MGQRITSRHVLDPPFHSKVNVAPARQKKGGSQPPLAIQSFATHPRRMMRGEDARWS
jgi:hypothetical protein